MNQSPSLRELTGVVVDASLLIHRDLGPGVFEMTYDLLLADELERRGLSVQRQLTLPITYRGRVIERAYRIDQLINGSVVLEIKATDKPSPVHRRQVLTYLRLLRLEVGLVLNFGLPTMKAGIERVYNDRVVP